MENGSSCLGVIRANLLHTVFFISFREALEAGIIVSVLLAILKKTFVGNDDAALHKALVRQVCFHAGDPNLPSPSLSPKKI